MRALLPALLSAVCVCAAAEDTISVSAEQMRRLGIETAAPLAASGSPGRTLPAEVVVPPGQLRVVSAPVAGMVEAVLAASGQPVRRGAPLLRLQSPELVEAQREFLHAASQSELAGQALRRDEALLREGIIAEGRYQAARAAAAQAEAAHARWRQTLLLYGMGDAALRRLQASGQMAAAIDIASPIDGVVVELAANPGQRVEAAAPLFRVARLSPLWLEIRATRDDAAGLAAGVEVALPAEDAAGRVLAVGRSMSAASQTLTVRAEITRGADRLRPGQMVEARVAPRPAAAGAAQQWRLPLAALARHQGKAYVFVQTAQGFVAREVTVLGENGEGGITLRGALRGDERCAVRGVAALKAAWTGVGGGE